MQRVRRPTEGSGQSGQRRGGYVGAVLSGSLSDNPSEMRHCVADTRDPQPNGLCQTNYCCSCCCS